jgi:hypothetical protein
MILRRTLLFFAAAALMSAPAHHASAREAVHGSRPTGDAVEVQIGVIVLNVDAIREAQQSITANIGFVAQWRDPRLAHDGDGEIRRPIDEVWHPRLQVVNRQDVTPTMPETVEISPDGTVVYRQRIWGSFSQSLELSDFPMDRQTFYIRAVSVGYTPDEIRFVPYPSIESGVVDSPTATDWTLEGFELRIEPYSALPGMRSIAGVSLEFTASRKLGYYVWKMLIPLMLIVAMSWIVFWMDPEVAAPQISVSVTAMLTLIAYRFMVGGMLPQISYLTRLDIFVLASTLLVFLTIVEATVTIGQASKGNKERALAIDRTCRWVVPPVFVAVVLLAFFA